MKDKLEDLHLRRKEALSAGSERAVKRQHDKGKLLARERLDYLIDDGSFHELDMLARHRAHTAGLSSRPYTDGVITGWGTVNGRKVFVFSQDFTVMGGALGEVFAEKLHKVMDMSLATGIPIIGLNDGAGARIQEGVVSLDGYGGIFHRNVAASGVIPQISVILGPCAGGAVYSPAMTDFVFMVRHKSHMFITGPGVVKTVTGESVTLEELGGATSHGTKSGVATFVGNSEYEVLDDVKKLLSFLPSNNLEQPPLGESNDPPDRLCPILNTILSGSSSFEYSLSSSSTASSSTRSSSSASGTPYDMRSLIAEVVDGDSFFEYHASWATNIVCGFAKVAGRSIGVVANQPLVLGGMLDINSSEKAARFVRTCDAFNIPLVTFVDVPGFRPGVDQEHGGIIRHGAKLLYAYCEATVPRISVIVHKAYGGAYVVMDSKSVGSDVSFAWPSAEIAVMGPRSAVEIMHREELKAAANPAERHSELVSEYAKQFATPYIAAERGFVDEVIEPAQTRQRIAASLKVLESKREDVPERKHGNVPL